MQRSEIIIILKKIKLAYPRFYNDISKQEAEDIVILWEEFFKNEDPSLVMLAVNSLISTFKFPPTIADIKEEMYKLTNKEQTPMELWSVAKEMIRNGLYMTQEKFDKYPKEVTMFFGGLSGLKDISMMDSGTVNSVIQSNFLKQVAIIQDRNKQEIKRMPLRDVEIMLLNKEDAKGDKINALCEGNTKSET